MRFQNRKPSVNKFWKDPFCDRAQNGELRPKVPLPTCPINLCQDFPKGSVAAAWLGHSSVFMQISGHNLLIDPVFSPRISPFGWLGPKRFPGTAPKPADFPTLDAILLTHDHYDHLDIPTLLGLDRQTKNYIVPKGLGGILMRHGIREEKIRELNWYEHTELPGLTICCTPAYHNSRRGIFDRDRTLWCSFTLVGADRSVFISGDTAFSEHFAEIHAVFGDMDMAIMECGQYGKYWHHMHMFPEESVEACRLLRARLAIPVHWGAYVLSTHAWDEPPKRFLRRAKEQNINCIIPQLNQICFV